MARMTIAQLREREIDRLVSFKTDSPTDADYEEARRNMNSFYRLCGLADRNLYLQNDERRYNTRYAREQEAKEDRWYKRLNKAFMETYGLKLMYFGHIPSITDSTDHEQITRWFYQ